MTCIVGGRKTFRELLEPERAYNPAYRVLLRVQKRRQRCVTSWWVLADRLSGGVVECRLILMGQSYDGLVGPVRRWEKGRRIRISADMRPTWEDPSD